MIAFDLFDQEQVEKAFLIKKKLDVQVRFAERYDFVILMLVNLKGDEKFGFKRVTLTKELDAENSASRVYI